MVPTLTFGVLYCFFVIGHDRRKILRFNLIRNPSALWIVRQMREAWPYASTPRFLLFDRDSKFGHDVLSAVREMGSEPVRTAYRSPCEHMNCQFNDMRYGQANQKQNTASPVRQSETVFDARHGLEGNRKRGQGGHELARLGNLFLLRKRGLRSRLCRGLSANLF